MFYSDKTMKTGYSSTRAFAGTAFACTYIRLITDAVLASVFVIPGLVRRVDLQKSA